MFLCSTRNHLKYAQLVFLVACYWIIFKHIFLIFIESVFDVKYFSNCHKYSNQFCWDHHKCLWKFFSDFQVAVTAKYNHLISETDDTRRDEFADHLSGLVILMNQWVGYHGGYLIQHPDSYAAVSQWFHSAFGWFSFYPNAVCAFLVFVHCAQFSTRVWISWFILILGFSQNLLEPSHFQIMLVFKFSWKK